VTPNARQVVAPFVVHRGHVRYEVQLVGWLDGAGDLRRVYAFFGSDEVKLYPDEIQPALKAIRKVVES
jgi:hypothetical protein